MHFRPFITVCLLVASINCAFSQQFLSVTPASLAPYDSMANLIRNHFTGAGVEIVNVESNNNPLAIGYFTDGNAAIDLQRGLLLTTGQAVAAEDEGNVFATANINQDNSLPPLEAIATGPLFDVSYFRITFRPFSDSIQFRYVFASEEYPEYACSNFNDVFGFFLSGPDPAGGVYTDRNIALIPGTNLPVAINNIHPTNPNQSPCPPLNLQYYHANENSSMQPVYDGYTDVFVAEAAVVPCETYVMLIAIADIGDHVYDSGVFLEARSLESEITITSTLDSGAALIPEIAIADTITFNFTEVPAHLLPLEIKILGTATNGIDFQALDSVTVVSAQGQTVRFVVQPLQDTLPEQIETVVFSVFGSGGSSCYLKDYTLYITDPDSLYAPVDTVFLLSSGSTTLTVVPTAISNKSWTYSNATPYPITPTFTLVKSEVSVDLPFEALEDIGLLQSVCLNINHSWDGDLDLYLFAPNGSFVMLSTNNGANGDHYTNTCFSPTATEDIRGGLPFAPASAAPFTGTFQPEGLWNDILGSPVNGKWALGVMDDQNNINGTLLDWNLTFSTEHLGAFAYLWSTGDTTPTIEVNTPGTYTALVKNKVGSFTQTFVVMEGNVGAFEADRGSQFFQLSPNPSKGPVTVILNQDVTIQSLKVIDLNGTIVLNQGQAGLIQGAQNLPAGIYFISLECDKGIFVQKMLRD